MNTLGTKLIVDQNNVVTLKADKSKKSPEIDKLLAELGNPSATIPFYAIFPADGSDPIVMDGVITQRQIASALEKAGPSKKQLKDTDAALKN